MNLRKVKWLVIRWYKPHKNYYTNHLESRCKVLNRNLSQYEIEFALKIACDIYHLKNLVNIPTC